MMEPIAIVGSACRFPGGSNTPSKLWELLKTPTDVRKVFPQERLNIDRFYHSNGEHHGSTNVRSKSYLLSDDHRRFDAAFFNINPMEADGMDPQQRMLLETVYEALESAGYPLEKVCGSQTSVHVGVMNTDYNIIQQRDMETLPTYNATGTAISILSNRISYFFDLKGPSVTIDTACSSSLVALHQAVQGLRTGDATSAIVAGANMILDPYMYIAESSLHMLSPDSCSRMWDKAANGYARGEGFAGLLLKPLSRAIADGDHVEAVVRETGINSDGRTRGITMPSHVSQAALIRRTYERAGLDPVKDRCQYFECHGTGTLAGDPVEAQAIRDAFFPEQLHLEKSGHLPNDKLYVGSIKTVVGHLEGCAGLAGIMKAMLAIKHRTIPPNMHFKNLNPAIYPFYDHLRVPINAIPWPETGQLPLRASVNSFGFGGTNAHAIIEGYKGLFYPLYGSLTSPEDIFIGPLVLSANSNTSLVTNVRNLSDRIKSDPSINMCDLTWTLHARRSVLPMRAFFSGVTVKRLLYYMDRFVTESEESRSDVHETKALPIDPHEGPGILGIFTGQGAQWASMGRSLVAENPLFRASIERCEDALAELPDGPSWSLKDELLKEAFESRIGEAALSQPLCTALQIGMVDLLRCAGIKLNTVVGHSSGEIAAVYAAGIINCNAAMKISYYRGHYAKRACGAHGELGRMMAVAMSFDDALAFCSEIPWAGRLVAAASNSPQSVTLSGDIDAIEDAKSLFDTRSTFARILKTDTAYHSHHMLACAEEYLRSLKSCDIEVNKPQRDCTWISSVRGDTELLNDLAALKDQYWVDNMCNPVLFSQAVETSIWNGGPFDVAVELGPHPALKGPTEQTIKAVYGRAPEYAGFMRRGDSEIEAFSGGVGVLWRRLGPNYVNVAGYHRTYAAASHKQPQLLKDLPSYAWDHDKIHWRESRISRRYRLRQDSGQELLGRRVPGDSDDDMNWRNVLRLSELPWLQGHIFQGQVLFPGAGYVSMALEAALAMARERRRPITLLEVEDVVLSRAMVIKERESTETVFTAKLHDHKQTQDDRLIADFCCYFCPVGGNESLVKACSGKLKVHYGQPSPDALPPRTETALNLVPLNMRRFYSAMKDVGLDYSGLFNGMRNGKRSLNTSSVMASWGPEMNLDYLVNPGFLDVAFQSLYVAFSSPASGGIWAPYLPIRIGRLAVNPNVSYRAERGIQMQADAFVTTASSTLIEGDIHICNVDDQCTGLQVESIAMQAMSEPREENDKCLFSGTVWAPDVLSGLILDNKNLEDDIQLVEVLDRVSLFYWQKLLQDLNAAKHNDLKWYHQRLVDAIQFQVASVRDGSHPVAKPEWLVDSKEVISTISYPYESRVDMRLIHAVGRNLHSVLCGGTHLLEIMLEDDMLNRFYMEGYGFSSVNNSISAVIEQLVFKYPHAHILEIGAGTGGTTRSIFDRIRDSFSSYTYTDISSAFFKNAAEKFRSEKSKMEFRVLDIEKDVTSQGFGHQEYDIVIAANVLHATRKLDETMEHVRALLKPGGFLVMMEITGPDILRTQFIMGGLPGWWYGVDDGRVLSPAISTDAWDKLLRNTGFSGADSILDDMANNEKHSFSLIVSQAMDNDMRILRAPISSLDAFPPCNHLIIGGKTSPISQTVDHIQELLCSWNRGITVCADIENAAAIDLSHVDTVVCLEELDRPLFADKMTQVRLSLLQRIMMGVKHVIWAIDSRDDQNPYVDMAVGLGRSLRTEIPDLSLHFVDLNALGNPSDAARVMVETLLQSQLSSSSEFDQRSKLWTVEQEIRVIGGRRFVPRILPNRAMNDVYNAERRLITKKASTKDVCLELVNTGGAFQAAEAALNLAHDAAPGCDRLDVQYALALSSVDCKNYLCSGIVREKGYAALAISSSNASVIEIPATQLVTVEDARNCTPVNLRATALHLWIHSLDEEDIFRKSVVVFEPDVAIAEALSAAGKKFLPLSSSSETLPGGWLKLHPRASRRTVQLCLPRDLSCVLDPFDRLPDNIKSCLPVDCPILRFALRDVGPGMLRSSYSAAVSRTMSPGEVPVYRPEDLVTFGPFTQQFVVDWNTANYLDVPLQPLNTTGLLSPDSTYLLAGMTGELGLSLSRWMVSNGARHIVLTSRNANVDKKWLQDMRKSGADVQVFRNDITDRDAVHSLINTIRKTMPPIAGVCNACMVLNDGLFAEMDAETLNSTLGPKMVGTEHLDEIFHDTSLDFFILFSSLASIIGNAGQANYHAANLFMTGIANQRKKRGLAASVMHIGLVTDVGYVARKGQEMEERLRKLFFMPLSESDLHHSFAQSILAGKSQSTQHEIIIGLQPFVDSPGVHSRPPWEGNPRFSHYVSRPVVQGEQTVAVLDTVNIKMALKMAKSEEAAIVTVQEAFGKKLESMMQLPSSSVNMNVPLIDLGCDSLLAIEIRGWFMKEVGIDVPVLKVLSGDTPSQLCEDAVRGYLALELEANRHATTESNIEAVENIPSIMTPTVAYEDGTSSQDSSQGGTASTLPNQSSSECTSDTPTISTPGDPEGEPSGEVKRRMVTCTQRASHAQSRLWFLTQYLQDPICCNVTVCYNIFGRLQASRLKSALSATICHHQCLQTCFFKQPGIDILMQGVLSPPSSSVNYIDGGSEGIVRQEYDRLKHHVWDLEHGESFCATIISLSPVFHTIVFGYHHIVMDGVSWHIFLQDLDMAYRMQPLPFSTKQYVDFSHRQILAAESGGYGNEIRFWREQHDPLLPVMPLLPIARTTTRDVMSTYESHVVSCVVGRDLVSQVKNASKLLRTTPFHFHLATIQCMFFRLLSLDDICIGVADANRTDDDFARTVGFFLNMLPVRFQRKNGCSFQEIVQRTKQKILEALSHSRVPFDLLLDALKIPRTANHSPLFQVAVNYRMGAMLEVPLGDNTMQIASSDDAKNPYDISFGVTDTAAETCVLELTTQTRLYSYEATGHLMKMYVSLLRSLSADPRVLLEDLPVSFSASIDDVAHGTGPRAESPWPGTLSERFDDTRRRFSTETALKDGMSTLTYGELSQRVNNIGLVMKNQGLRVGDKVAVLCLPSADAIASMLATLRMGCIYVPLDTRLPIGRQVAIIEDCKPALILCQSHTRDTALQLQATHPDAVSVVDVQQSLNIGEDMDNAASPNNPAFLFYTSGTTGVPKGVLLTQKNFANHIAFKSKILSIGREVVLQQSSFGFDMSVVQTYCALANGGMLVVAPRETRGDPVALSNLMLRENVTFTIATPSEYAMMLRYCTEPLKQLRAWRQACMGGEAVTPQLVQEFRNLQRLDMKLTNCYGPMETTAAATFHDISLDQELPAVDGSLVGKPLPNYSVYILDESGHALPHGLAGEICIGGAGVAQGYLHLFEQTQLRFVRDSYASPEDVAKGWTTMYKTGDKGRLLEDGTLVFMGRMDGDTQVKLRGLRIELDDISNSLIKVGSNQIADAIVTVRGDTPFLVAHVTAVPGANLDQDNLQRLIAQLPLPQYMRPSMIIPLERLPTTSNGKVDRAAIAKLPLVNQEAQSPVPQKPLSTAEGELRLLWEMILPPSPNASRLEPESDFFMRGGNSMLLVRLQGTIKDFMGVSVSVMQLYQSPTLRQMASCVHSQKTQQLVQDEVIDWFHETALGDAITEAAENQSPRKPCLSHGRQVLLTGSTSFLGMNILESLISDPTVAMIHCIAVLPEEKGHLPASSKISVITGSLLWPNLGLSDTDYDKLRSRVDVILHAGAVGHCLNRYSSLRVPNVHSTRFLAAFAVRQAIPIHYLSSNRVALLSGSTATSPISVSSSFPRSDGAEGFTASKWASERILELVARYHNLEVHIHRTCAAIGEKAPNEDALNALLKYSRLTQRVPQFENFDGYLDFKDVREIAKAVAQDTVRCTDDATHGKARFVHHSSGHKVAMRDFSRHMEWLYGGCFEEVPMADWVEGATERGIDPLVTGYLETMTQKGETIQFPYLGEQA